MGEVSFAAVLRWVTRVDDFTKLFADTCERERVLHLQRSEECALSYLNWRASPSDHFAVRAARAHISDYGCQFFAKQLRLVSSIVYLCFIYLFIFIHFFIYLFICLCIN